VKEEDLDWLVYHLLLDDTLQDSGRLAARARCPEREIAASLARLESSYLIVREGSWYRVLSFQEFILASQARHDPASPIAIEGGVIRQRKGPS
jgi:hypothetical protein